MKAVIFPSASGKRILPLPASYLAISECRASSEGSFVVPRLTGLSTLRNEFFCGVLQLIFVFPATVIALTHAFIVSIRQTLRCFISGRGHQRPRGSSRLHRAALPVMSVLCALSSSVERITRTSQPCFCQVMRSPVRPSGVMEWRGETSPCLKPVRLRATAPSAVCSAVCAWEGA